MVRFEILLWLYGAEKFPGLSKTGPRSYFSVVPRLLLEVECSESNMAGRTP